MSNCLLDTGCKLNVLSTLGLHPVLHHAYLHGSKISFISCYFASFPKNDQSHFCLIEENLPTNKSPQQNKKTLSPFYHKKYF